MTGQYRALPPICADCEDHGDGSCTCDVERPACRYRVRPYDDVNPAPKGTQMSNPRTLAELLTEWGGVGRHQTITFEGAAELVRAALADESEARRAAAAMTDDELTDALNWWHLRQSEQGR